MAIVRAVRSALREALEDEYKAIATYRAVIDRFGAIRPFPNLLAAEQRHAAALERLCERHGVAPPRWPSRVTPPPAGLLEACRAGARAEIENAALYDRLIAQATGHPDVQRVFVRLRTASRERHLTAFRRCIERESARGAKRSATAAQPAGRRGDVPACGGPGPRTGRGGRRGPNPARRRIRGREPRPAD